MKLFTKYTLVLLALLLMTAMSIMVLALQLQQRAQTREALLRGESIASNLALGSSNAIHAGNLEWLVQRSMEAKAQAENVAYTAIVDAKGRVVAHQNPHEIGKPFAFIPSGEELRYDILAQVMKGQSQGVRVWDLSLPLAIAGRTSAPGRVHVGIDQAGVLRSVRNGLKLLIGVSMASLALAMGINFLAVRILVRPLHELSGASARVGAGDFDVAVPVRGHDEVAGLASDFNRMVSNLRQAESRKHEAGRIEGELELAHGIQARLLPTQAPDIPGVELAFFCEPAKELGGDYYDWFKVDGGRSIGVVVADVSGKGIPAALHTANLRNLFRFITARHDSPMEVIREVNAMAHADLKGNAFVTLIYAVLDPQSGLLRYVNAGHDPAYVLRRDGSLHAHPATAFPIGAVESAEFDKALGEERLVLEKGELFFLYTDGVTEAMNRQKRQFGLEGIQNRLTQEDPGAIILHLREDLKAHLDGQAAQDDVTMLALRRTDLNRTL
jgi:serine phosphatase RsbU (regulator of sigma subunit)